MKVTRSREVINCGHDHCSWSGQRRLLPRHTTSKHTGFAPREKIMQLENQVTLISYLNSGTSNEGE